MRLQGLVRYAGSFRKMRKDAADHTTARVAICPVIAAPPAFEIKQTRWSYTVARSWTMPQIAA